MRYDYSPPETRATPPFLLAALREIDPRAELLYAGEARWWLGVHDPNDERTARATNLMRSLERIERSRRVATRTMLLASLNMQGFALIETYVGTDPAGTVLVNPGPDEYHTTILEDFRWRDAEWRKDQGSAIVKERFLDTIGETQRREHEAMMKDYLANDGRQHYRRFMRGRVQVGYGSSSPLMQTNGISPLILPERV